jgi:hypothetical protein
MSAPQELVSAAKAYKASKESIVRIAKEKEQENMNIVIEKINSAIEVGKICVGIESKIMTEKVIAILKENGYVIIPYVYRNVFYQGNFFKISWKNKPKD